MHHRVYLSYHPRILINISISFLISLSHSLCHYDLHTGSKIGFPWFNKGETIETNWSRDGLRLKSDNLRRCCSRLQDRGAVQGRSESWWRCIAHRRGGREARLARGGIREYDAYWVMKWGAQQGLSVVASRWMGGGKAKAQGRGMGRGAIACHHHHVSFRICLCISAFCLDEKVCWRTSVLCTHIHEFLYISHLFNFVYSIVIFNIWFCTLDVIIGRRTWNC